jgi:Homeodomain
MHGFKTNELQRKSVPVVVQICPPTIFHRYYSPPPPRAHPKNLTSMNFPMTTIHLTIYPSATQVALHHLKIPNARHFMQAIPITNILLASQMLCPDECVYDHHTSRLRSLESCTDRIHIPQERKERNWVIVLACECISLISLLQCSTPVCLHRARRYQSITNWFQNQRSLAKRRREEGAGPSTDDPSAETSMIDFPKRDPRLSTFPPSSRHSSLALHPPPSHTSLGAMATARRSPSVSLPSAPTAAVVELSPVSRRSTPTRRSTPRRSSTPYQDIRRPLSARPRRTRPEPYQLDALRRLFTITSNPTIEQRTSLADEVNM